VTTSRPQPSAESRDLRWIVDKPGLNLLAVLEQMGAPREAVAQGRVFVQRRRIAAYEQDRKLELGDEVQVYGERATAAVKILAEHNGVLAVSKPAGISTQPDHRGAEHSLLGELATNLGQPIGTLHALQRLDREVSGVLLVARTEEGRQWVLNARGAGQFKRRYLAIASGAPSSSQGEWTQAIGRGSRPGLRAVSGREAETALTKYALIAQPSAAACLFVAEPVTGRTHQIRVHAAAAGAPLLGDRDYGGLRRVVAASGAVHDLSRIALHALFVQVARPKMAPWRNEAAIPPELLELWQWMGGQQSDFDGLSARFWL
jgi:23S rRNA-/tRNA-specific pseudouridylate synthase